MNQHLDIDRELLQLVRSADPMLDPVVRAGAGLQTEAALRVVALQIDQPTASSQARPHRRSGLRVVALAVVLVAAVFVVANLAPTATNPAVPPAQARTLLRHIHDALAWPRHAIYEELTVGTTTARNGATFSSGWHEWLSTSPPYNSLEVNFADGKILWEQAFVNARLDLYDPVTNTIYIAPSVIPFCRASASGGTGGCRAPDQPQWNSALSEVQDLLRDPATVIDAGATLHGRPAIELTSDHGRFSVWISPRTYQPLQVEDRGDGLPDGQPGVGITRYPITRVLTGSAARPSLVSLQARHPAARIDRRPSDYASAQWRLIHVRGGSALARNCCHTR